MLESSILIDVVFSAFWEKKKEQKKEREGRNVKGFFFPRVGTHY
jgi:hypothetical protein